MPEPLPDTRPCVVHEDDAAARRAADFAAKSQAITDHFAAKRAEAAAAAGEPEPAQKDRWTERDDGAIIDHHAGRMYVLGTSEHRLWSHNRHLDLARQFGVPALDFAGFQRAYNADPRRGWMPAGGPQ